MGFRFFKRINIAPGVTLNLSKSGGSVSVGPRGAKVTLGPRGPRATVGIPGTGLYYTTKLSAGQSAKRTSSRKASPGPALSNQPAQPALLAAAVPDEDKALVDGCRALAGGDEAAALDRLRQAVHLADGAFLAGFLALKGNSLDEAAKYLKTALERQQELGRGLAKYGLTPEVDLAITEEVSARIGADARGVLLALAETYQRQDRWAEAIESLRRLSHLEPQDVVVKLSLAELLLEHKGSDEQANREVVTLAQEVENESPVHTALLLYKARALRGLGLLEAAEDVLAQVLRRKKDRPAELLCALQYERAINYEAMGRSEQARVAFQKVYALSPDYEDVAARLGL